MHSQLKGAPPGTLTHRIWTELIEKHGEEAMGTRDMKEAIEFVAENPDHAIILPINVARLNSLYPCSIVELPGITLNKMFVSFAFQKDSPLTEMFDFYLKQMVKSGVVQHTRRAYFERQDVNCASDIDGELTVKSLFSIFFILILGAAIALLLLFMESCMGVLGPLQQRTRGPQLSPMDRDRKTSYDSMNSMSEEKAEPIDTFILLEIISQQRIQIEEKNKILELLWARLSKLEGYDL